MAKIEVIGLCRSVVQEDVGEISWQADVGEGGGCSEQRRYLTGGEAGDAAPYPGDIEGEVGVL